MYGFSCAGLNSNAQLGLGDTTNRGNTAGSMGTALPAVDLGASKLALKVAAGRAHTCVLLTDRTVKCFGLNNRGQLLFTWSTGSWCNRVYNNDQWGDHSTETGECKRGREGGKAVVFQRRRATTGLLSP
jgi:alpha-tubulin suppressor-like RCC1 family protein